MRTLIPAISTVAVGLFALPASAGLIYHEFEGNDCSGYFGKGEACQIFIDQEDERIEISPLITGRERAVTHRLLQQ